jgi:haloalkane dehalogenase
MSVAKENRLWPDSSEPRSQGQGDLTDAEKDAYRAPFPSEDYLAGARQFPVLVPISPDDRAADANRNAWRVLSQWDKPMLLCFSDGDPITATLDHFFRERVPGTKGQPHVTLQGGHFIQEEDGERWARAVVDWLAAPRPHHAPGGS